MLRHTKKLQNRHQLKNGLTFLVNIFQQTVQHGIDLYCSQLQDWKFWRSGPT